MFFLEAHWRILSNKSHRRRFRSGDRSRDAGPALESHYRFVAWLIQKLERLPRRQEFLLGGGRIQTSALDVLERLIEATYTRRRGPVNWTRSAVWWAAGAKRTIPRESA